MKSSLLLGSLFLMQLVFGLSLKSQAESYVGVQTGFAFDNKVGNFRADVNTNYPNGEGPGPKFIGSKLTDADLDETFTVGAKAGHFFEVMPFLGIEAEFNYLKPDFNKQILTLTNPNLPGPALKLQNQASVNVFSTGTSLIARYPAFKRVMPYVGVGPTLKYIRVRGNGNDVLDYRTPETVVAGPEINQDKIALGLQAKAGLRLAATKHLAVDVEYKYNYCPVRMGQFRNLENVRGGFNSHQVGLALVYRFGKIKW